MSKSSKNSIRVLLTLLLCAVLMTSSMFALAVSIDRGSTGSITLQPTYGGNAVDGGRFELYRVASLADNSTQLSYNLIEPFVSAGTGDLAKCTTADLQRTAAGLLNALKGNADPDDVITLDRANGDTVTGLELGVYLVVQVGTPMYYTAAAPFLIYLPMTNSEGDGWDYSVTAQPKMGYDPPTYPSYTSASVEKVWEDENNPDRPTSVTAVLYQNGNEIASVVLNAANNWRHTWNNLSTGYTYTITEDDVPEGYTLFEMEEGTHFVLTNTLDDIVPLTRAIAVDKVWVGDDENIRPGSISVTLKRDGADYETVSLSNDNDWSHVWIGLSVESEWSITENNVPAGYTSSVAITNDGNAFTITNSYGTAPTPSPSPSPDIDIDDKKPPTSNAPQTGMLQWPIPVLSIFGTMCIAGGASLGHGKKKSGK